jgi:acetylornithine deacetylase
VIDAIRSAVDARLDDLHDLTARLVRERSLLGDEEGAQRLVEDRLRGLGFAVERVGIDAGEALADPRAGIPLLSYAGRTNVAGRLAGSQPGAASMHLSGHVDVVPVEGEERWTYDPWGGEIADGRLWGRGSGDMKAGIACYLVAVDAFTSLFGPPPGDLLFTTVIEEECGGNGMRAVLAAGYDANATLIAEPHFTHYSHGGVGVIWARLSVQGAGKHAAYADQASTTPPIQALVDAVQALRALEAELNAAAGDAAFAGAFAHPYNLNLGEIGGGAWPSSVPADAYLRVRLGFGRDLEPADAQRLVAERLAAAAPEVRVTFEGFRAHAYLHDPETPLAAVLREAHGAVTGTAIGPSLSTATTDARYVTEPVYCYGPEAGNGHGIDEWVDVASMRDVTATMVAVLARWYGIS